MSTFAPLKLNAEVRDATRRPRIFDRTLSNSSARPSAKYSLAVSSLVLTKGRTAIEGLSATSATGSVSRGLRRVRRSLGPTCERKAVAFAGDGSNGVGTEDLAQRRHLHVEVVLLDHQSRPRKVEQLVLGNHPLASLDESQQNIECALAQRRRLIVDQELSRVPGSAQSDRICSSPSRHQRRKFASNHAKSTLTAASGRVAAKERRFMDRIYGGFRVFKRCLRTPRIGRRKLSLAKQPLFETARRGLGTACGDPAA